MRPSNAYLPHAQYTSGVVWYVDGVNGLATNSGRTPATAFLTIGAAITACAAGDNIVVGPATYTETGLNLNKDSVQMWLHLGAILDPASGTVLTVSGNYCRVASTYGAAKFAPAANETGMVISGNFVYVDEVRVTDGSVADLGFDITGEGCDLRRCRCSNPLIAAFKIQGDKNKLEDCCTGGEVADASIGFWVTNSCDKTRLRACSSQGHASGGFVVDAGVTNGVAKDCSSGGGDGSRLDPDHAFVWSDYTFDSVVANDTTFAGAPTTYNIVEVTGTVRLKNIYGMVTTQIANTGCTIYLEAYSVNGTADITDAPGLQIQNIVVDSYLVRSEASTSALVLAQPSAGPAVAESVSYKDPKTEIDVVADPGATTYIRVVLSAALASGAIHWHCEYDALSDDGFVEPA